MAEIFSNLQLGTPMFGLGSTWSFVFAVVLIWSLVWKGMALWKSARSGSRIWFVVLLVVNTVGILEILYIYLFSKRSKPV